MVMSGDVCGPWTVTTRTVEFQLPLTVLWAYTTIWYVPGCNCGVWVAKPEPEKLAPYAFATSGLGCGKFVGLKKTCAPVGVPAELAG